MKRKIIVLIILIALGALGCSLLDNSDLQQDEGIVSLRLIRNGAAAAAQGPALSALQQALITADSILVEVYGPGNGSNMQTSKGAGIPPATDTVRVSLTVIAENDKRVAVELFEAGRLTYFGVNPDVDVAAGENTRVSIIASSFEVANFWRDKPIVADGDDFELFWNSVPGATAYLLQESATSDFGTIRWETTIPDTSLLSSAMGFDIEPGQHYFRVAAENVYATGEFSREQFLNVYAPPEITSISKWEGPRGDSLTIRGAHLDFPGTTVSIGKTECVVALHAPGEIHAWLPAQSYSDTLRVTNSLGTAKTSDRFRVQTIAYIMGDDATGDWANAGAYKSIIEAYGDVILHGAVMILPYDWATALINLGALDMGVFDMIIVGHDTGTSKDDWAGGLPGSLTLTAEIAGSKASVLGIGRGGALYFELIALTIGIDHSTEGNHRDAYVWNATSPIYKIPNDLGVGVGDRIDVYTLNSIVLSVDWTGSEPTITADARRTLPEASYPLIEERGGVALGAQLHFLWGFTHSPVRLTNGVGDHLLENVIRYVYISNSRVVIPIE